MKINASAGMTKPHGTPRIQKVEEVGAKVWNHHVVASSKGQSNADCQELDLVKVGPYKHLLVPIEIMSHQALPRIFPFSLHQVPSAPTDVVRESKPGKNEIKKRSETCQEQTPGKYNLNLKVESYRSGPAV